METILLLTASFFLPVIEILINRKKTRLLALLEFILLSFFPLILTILRYYLGGDLSAWLIIASLSIVAFSFTIVIILKKRQSSYIVLFPKQRTRITLFVVTIIILLICYLILIKAKGNIGITIFVVVTYALMAFIEEMLYRVVLFDLLHSKINLNLSVIFSSVIFFLVHLPMPILSCLLIFGLSFFLFLIKEKYRSFYLIVCFHFLYNIIILFMYRGSPGLGVKLW